MLDPFIDENGTMRFCVQQTDQLQVTAVRLLLMRNAPAGPEAKWHLEAMAIRRKAHFYNGNQLLPPRGGRWPAAL